jgi:hypothetical protein
LGNSCNDDNQSRLCFGEKGSAEKENAVPQGAIPKSAKKLSNNAPRGRIQSKCSQPSPSIKRDAFKLDMDVPKKSSSMTRNCLVGTLSKTDSNYMSVVGKKPKQPVTPQCVPGTPKHLSSPTESVGVVDIERGVSLISITQNTSAVITCKRTSHVRISSSNSSINSIITDASQATTNRSIYATNRQRPPSAVSRYAQSNFTSSSASDHVLHNLRSSSDLANIRKGNVRTRGASVADYSAGNQLKASIRPTSVPLKKKAVTAPPSDGAVLTSTWTSDSVASCKTSNSAVPQSNKYQAQAAPKTPRQCVLMSPVADKSASKTSALTNSVGSKKQGIGKLFGLVGFNKADAQSQSHGPVSHTPAPAWPIDARSGTSSTPGTLDQNMKLALQREATARAALLAAEAAAGNARLAATLARAEAVAVARAIVREAEIEQTLIESGRGCGNTVAAPTTCTITTAAMTDSECTLEKILWTNPSAVIDGLSPKRDAENPFKGMF